MPGHRAGARLPKIYFVNWFRKDRNGKFVWPGFGDNSRVLKWIFERVTGKADAQETPIGLTPTAEALDLTGLDISREHLDLLLNVDLDVWREEASLVPGHYERFGDRLPQELWDQLASLNARLEASSAPAPKKVAVNA